MPDSKFKPALIVVDLQEDFCPPNGSLAVPSGRDVVPTINALMALPGFAARIATKDWHPPDHVSFATNHQGKRPFEDTHTVVHPDLGAEEGGSYETRLWPVHCVQGTGGAELLPELDVALVDEVVEKGQDARVEMYSAFRDPLKVSDSGLAGRLRERGVSDVFVVGLAADYCVKSTAVDAVEEGFRSWIVEEGTRAVDPDGWPKCREEIERKGVKVISVDGEEVGRMRARRKDE